MKAVLDANVSVSTLINTCSTPQQIINLWLEEAFEPFSEGVLGEVGRVLRYAKMAALQKVPEPELQEFLRFGTGKVG